VPEQPTMSIRVRIAPQVAGGLTLLVRQLLTGVAAQKPPKAERKARRPIVNRAEGTVRGTLFQIGNVEGDVNNYGDR
jgi:hypothetical protein